jgi:hypothetical protein
MQKNRPPAAQSERAAEDNVQNKGEMRGDDEFKEQSVNHFLPSPKQVLLLLQLFLPAIIVSAPSMKQLLLAAEPLLRSV